MAKIPEKANAVRVHTPEGPLLVLLETGEVIEGPNVPDERADWLIRRYREAREAISGWEVAVAGYGAVLKGILSESELTSLKTGAGTAGIRAGRDSRRGDPDKIPEAVKLFELTDVHVREVLSTATALSLAELDARERAGKLPKGVAQFLTVGAVGDPYLMVTGPRAEPPQVEFVHIMDES